MVVFPTTKVTLIVVVLMSCLTLRQPLWKSAVWSICLNSNRYANLRANLSCKVFQVQSAVCKVSAIAARMALESKGQCAGSQHWSKRISIAFSVKRPMEVKQLRLCTCATSIKPAPSKTSKRARVSAFVRACCTRMTQRKSGCKHSWSPQRQVVKSSNSEQTRTIYFVY